MSCGVRQMWNMGVDEMLVLSKKFKAFSDAFPDDWVPSDDEEEEQEGSTDDDVSHEADDHVGDDGGNLAAGGAARSGGSEASKDKDYEVEAILNVRVCDDALRQSKGTSTPSLLCQSRCACFACCAKSR